MNMVFDQLQNQIQNANKQSIQFGSPNDFEADFNYNNKYVGIFSLGDTNRSVADAIDRYKTKGVDTLIIAYNTQFKNLPSQFFKADEIVIIKKTSNNQNDCNSIISKI